MYKGTIPAVGTLLRACGLLDRSTGVLWYLVRVRSTFCFIFLCLYYKPTLGDGGLAFDMLKL